MKAIRLFSLMAGCCLVLSVTAAAKSTGSDFRPVLTAKGGNAPAPTNGGNQGGSNAKHNGKPGIQIAKGGNAPAPTNGGNQGGSNAKHNGKPGIQIAKGGNQGGPANGGNQGGGNNGGGKKGGKPVELA